MSRQKRYQSYLLRLWLAADEKGSLWRASLENPHTGEHLTFATPERLRQSVAEAVRNAMQQRLHLVRSAALSSFVRIEKEARMNKTVEPGAPFQPSRWKAGSNTGSLDGCDRRRLPFPMSKRVSRWLWHLRDMLRGGNRRIDFCQVI